MDAVNFSSCSARVEGHSTTATALFEARLRALYRRRLVLTRAALLAQFELFQFDLQELQSARDGPPGTTSDAQLSLQDSVPAHTVKRRVVNAGNALSPPEDASENRRQMLTRRVRESALKVTTLASDLKSAIVANERAIDPTSNFDMQQILRRVCTLVPSFPRATNDLVYTGGVSSGSLVTPPLESVNMLVEKALSVGSRELAPTPLDLDAAIQEDENDNLQEERDVEQVSVAKSFFSEEFRLLCFTECGAVSFQGQSTQESLRMSELYLLRKTKPLIPPSYHDGNLSEIGIGKLPTRDSVTSAVSVLNSEASYWNQYESLHFNLRLRPRRMRFPVFQRRTYLYNQGRYPDELRAGTAPWCPDVDIPSFGAASVRASCQILRHPSLLWMRKY